MIHYMDRLDEKDLFSFKNISYEEYNKKYRYLVELNSFIYKTPILIEKLYFYNNNINNIVFQSQYIRVDIIKKLDEEFPLLRNSHFSSNLEKYLDNYLELKNEDDLLNILLCQYLVYDIFDGKIKYNLNDISGFIDLFDGIFIDLKIKIENISDSKSQREKLSKSSLLNQKIDYVLDKLEPSLKQYKINQDKNLIKVLSYFRNMVRHQKEYIKFDLEKCFVFAKGVLQLYVIKHILEISDKDYDINKILADFDIYPLVKHKYKYKNDEIIIYNTDINIQNPKLNENSVTYQTLISHEQFKDAQPDDFVYDESFTEEIKRFI